MSSLIFTINTLTVNLSSEHLEVVTRDNDLGLNHKHNVPLFDIDRVLISGNCRISMPVLKRFCKLGIPVYFLSSAGKWLGTLSPDNNMNGERRLCQYRVAHDKELAVKVTRKIIHSKLNNSKRVLQRLAANRKQSEQSEQTDAITRIKKLIHQLDHFESIDQLRGCEGMGAAIYFSRLSAFFPSDIPFTERNRRPPKDAANALLSWTYTIVLSEIEGAVRSHGLDSCLGFLHAVSHGTPSLPLDLLESLRAPVCDLLTLQIFNHKVLQKEDFEFRSEDGGTYLKKKSHKRFFEAYEQHMTRQFTPAKGGDHVDFRKVIDQQVCQILKVLEGRDDYEFFQMP